MANRIAITGLGMVTPLGQSPRDVLAKIEAGVVAQGPPSGMDASPFACPVCAEVRDWQPSAPVSEPKMLRLMNRDAKLAVAAAQAAVKDAGIIVGEDYRPEDIALFGATGMAGMPLSEISGLLKASVTADGQFDPSRFGQEGLRSINPLLSFKILSNMPVCFVSICLSIQGPNAIYTPWEGQGAQAIASGMRAIQTGEVNCALVGGSDVKTHELAFLSLEQHGLFDSWKSHQAGTVPGEGAVFLVLEDDARARARGAPIYARLAGAQFGTLEERGNRVAVYVQVLRQSAAIASLRSPILVAAADGDESNLLDETQALAEAGLVFAERIYPKRHAGNLFAAAAALQVAVGALKVEQANQPVLANCFGYGGEQSAFILEQP